MPRTSKSFANAFWDRNSVLADLAWSYGWILPARPSTQAHAESGLLPHILCGLRSLFPTEMQIISSAFDGGDLRPLAIRSSLRAASALREKISNFGQ